MAHDVASFVPHVDVYIVELRAGARDFYSLVTSGLSDFQATGAFGRIELVFYCREVQDEYLLMLRNASLTLRPMLTEHPQQEASTNPRRG